MTDERQDPATSIKRRRRRSSKKSKNTWLDTLLNERLLFLLVCVLAILFMFSRMQAFKALAYYSDALPLQPSSEILYAKGKPAIVRLNNDNRLEWVYQSPPVRVVFDANNQVQSVSCSSRNTGAKCPPVLGIETGTDELALTSILGSPNQVQSLEGAKIFIYQDVGLAFRLEQFRVRALEVRRRGDRLDYIKRFLIWVIPPAV